MIDDHEYFALANCSLRFSNTNANTNNSSSNNSNTTLNDNFNSPHFGLGQNGSILGRNGIHVRNDISQCISFVDTRTN